LEFHAGHYQPDWYDGAFRPTDAEQPMSNDDPVSPDAFAALSARFQQQSRKAQAYYNVIHEAAGRLGGDAAADAWMNTPLAALQDQTPAQLVGAGREEEVLAEVRALKKA
jgi:hypothetical protein